MPGADEAVADVADELYGVPPEQFVATRDAAARAAKQDGDKTLADAIGRLRKPTVAAWVVNLVVRDDPSLADGLRGLGDALREAQDQLDGPALRELGKQRRELVAALVARGRRLAAAAGHKLGEGVRQEVDETFTAALADPQVAQEVTSGRLVVAREFVGFGSQVAPSDVPAVAPRLPTPRADKPARPPRSTVRELHPREAPAQEEPVKPARSRDASVTDLAEERARRARRREAERRLAAAEKAWTALEAVAERARARREEAQGRLDDAGDRLSRAQQDAAEAEAEQEERARELVEARRRHTAAQTRATRAQEAVTKARTRESDRRKTLTSAEKELRQAEKEAARARAERDRVQAQVDEEDG